MGRYVDAALREQGVLLKSAAPLGDALTRKEFIPDYTVVSGFLGGPATAFAMEYCKPRRVVFLGVCGARRHDSFLPELGDLFVPDICTPGDGTAHGYGSARTLPHPTPEVQQSFTGHLEKAFMRAWRGSIASADTPQRETSADTVDMEAGALFQVSRLLNSELLAAYIISDRLGQDSIIGAKFLHKKLKLLASESISFLRKLENTSSSSEK